MSELVVKEKISEEVTCAICLELFEDPRLLNCLHTFCKACCIKIANNNAIVCPTCRKTTELQPKRLANNNYNNLDEIDNAYEHQDINLPSNWIVANIVLHLNQQQQQLQQQAHKNNSPAANNNKADSNSVYYCENCPEESNTPATKFCAECEAKLCDECSASVHSLRKFKHHAVKEFVASDEHNSVNVNPHNEEEIVLCSIHNEKLQLYCVDCDLTLCSNCVFSNNAGGNGGVSHKGHETVLVSEKIDEVKQNIARLLRRTKDRAHEAESCVKELEEHAESLREHHEACVALAEAHFEELERALAKRKQCILDQLNEYKNLEDAEIARQKQELKNALAVLRSSVEFAELVLSDSSPVHIISMYSTISARLEELNTGNVAGIGTDHRLRKTLPELSFSDSGNNLPQPLLEIIAAHGGVSAVTLPNRCYKEEDDDTSSTASSSSLSESGDASAQPSPKSHHARHASFGKARAVPAGLPAGARFIKRFTYSHNYDGRGLFYWLGTKRGHHSYMNPHKLGYVVAEASSLRWLVSDPADFVEHGVGRLESADKPGSWFSVSLMSMMLASLCGGGGGNDGNSNINNNNNNNASSAVPLVGFAPTHYTLSFWKGGLWNCPRNWELQGVPIEGEFNVDWVTIMLHMHDQTFSPSCKTMTWKIVHRQSQPAAVAPAPAPASSSSSSASASNGASSSGAGAPSSSTTMRLYKQFRIVSTGPNSSGNHVLAVSGLELYGDLYVF